MQLTSNAPINLVSPKSGDWSDFSESRVNGREQRSSQHQRRISEKIKWDWETGGASGEGEKKINDTYQKLIIIGGFACSLKKNKNE